MELDDQNGYAWLLDSQAEREAAVRIGVRLPQQEVETWTI